MLTAACLLIINPVTAENSDVRPAWKDSLYGSSSFSLFLVGDRKSQPGGPGCSGGGEVAGLVFVGSSCGSEQVADKEIWLLH